MDYLEHKEFRPSLRTLQVSGGRGQKVKNKITSVLGSICPEENPFANLKVTNHGESRIRHCVKYDLGDGYRLITIQNKNFVLFCYAGTHDHCDRWLERNRGLIISRDGQNTFQPIKKTEIITDAETRIAGESDGIEKRLFDRLSDKYKEILLQNISPLVILKLVELDNLSSDDDICELCLKIGDNDLATLVYDVLIMLKSGDLDQARERIKLYQGETKEIDSLTANEFIEIEDGDTIRRLDISSPEYLEWLNAYIESSNYQDWMLFMHPAQQKMVNADFAGPAKLSGVSGSGKTCIIVKRAIRLAHKKPAKPILILTLNRSLAALIKDLVDYACPKKDERKLIQVKSFFALCQEYLDRFEPQNRKLYNEVTWKCNEFMVEEHIDEIWREYYHCELNNNDAEVLFPIHKSLNARWIFPEKYIRQEFDWIRSALAEHERSHYLDLERKGRTVPFQKPWRELILQALAGWERKMHFVGIIDYLGLTTALARHFDELTPAFSSVLVDEAQDFGTLELKIIRKLVPEGENDIFLCGDMAQHVLPKQINFKKAGLAIPGARSRTILKNYRNSREILQAAYEVLVNNLDEDIIMDSDLEILDPEYANFSTPKPHVFSADTLEQEIGFALEYMKIRAKGNEGQHKGCIAIAGFTLLEIKKFADQLQIPVLDGSKDLQISDLFFSDLEQTKGYEFDTICILNCKEDVLPDNRTPEGERYRDTCRFYVAMTRAKRDLILSYSRRLSSWIKQCKEFFEFDHWNRYIDTEDIVLTGTPEKIFDCHEQTLDISKLTGRKFLYTSHAIGCSLELQDKIDELIDGRGRLRNRQAVAWKDIQSAYDDVRRHPAPKQLFGRQTHKEFLGKVTSLTLNE